MQRKYMLYLLWITYTSVVVFIVHWFPLFFNNVYPIDGFGYTIMYHFTLMAWFSIIINLSFIDYESKYYEPMPFELSKKIYMHMGVDVYRAGLKFIGWEKITSLSNVSVNRSSNNFKIRILNTKKSELAHTLILILSILTTVYLFKYGYSVKWMVIGSIIFHFYPIILQRYNRLRFSNVLNKINAQNNAPPTTPTEC